MVTFSFPHIVTFRVMIPKVNVPHTQVYVDLCQSGTLYSDRYPYRLDPPPLYPSLVCANQKFVIWVQTQLSLATKNQSHMVRITPLTHPATQRHPLMVRATQGQPLLVPATQRYHSPWFLPLEVTLNWSVSVRIVLHCSVALRANSNVQ